MTQRTWPERDRLFAETDATRRGHYGLSADSGLGIPATSSGDYCGSAAWSSHSPRCNQRPSRQSAHSGSPRVGRPNGPRPGGGPTPWLLVLSVEAHRHRQLPTTVAWRPQSQIAEPVGRSVGRSVGRTAGPMSRRNASARGRTRTCDPRLRRPSLYPAELRGREVPRVSARLGGGGGSQPPGWGGRAARPQAGSRRRRIVHGNAPFAAWKLPTSAAPLMVVRDRAELHDVIWLVVLSTALILLWGSSDRWSLAGLWRRVGHVLHLDHRADGVDHRR
jgi:hypothetical protein